jgi:hypothetical protein
MAVRTRTGGAAAVMTVFVVIAIFLFIGILIVVGGANQRNDLINFVMTIAKFFAHPFNHLLPQHTVKADIAVNWGIGAVAYLILGGILSRLVERL